MADTDPTMTALTIEMHEAVQAFVIFITIGCFIFFSIEYVRGRATWEILWVSFIEAFCYTLATFLPTEWIPVFGPKDLPMIRYMSWMLTCPVLIKVMIYSVSKEPDLVRNNKLVIADILMNALGIFACLYEDLLITMVFFIMGCFVAIYIIKGVFSEYAVASLQLDQPKARMSLMALMLISWTIFPFLFLFGPECTDMMTQPTSVMVHSFADLIAKNFYSGFAWRIALNSRYIQEKLGNTEGLKASKTERQGLSKSGRSQGDVNTIALKLKEEMKQIDEMKERMQDNLKNMSKQATTPYAASTSSRMDALMR